MTARRTESPPTYVPPGELLFDAAEVQAAVRRQADLLHPRLAGVNPLVLTVMQGGLYYAAWLTLAVGVPLELDYVHVSRYRDRRSGGELHWLRRPTAAKGRTVLVVDDVLDEGATLEAVCAACRDAGAAEVLATALVRKRRGGPVANRPDLFVALEAPDRFLVGCGLDFAGRWRNLPALYALAREDS